MPKSLGINQKAEEARARKAAKKAAEQAKIEKEKEDAKWVEDDKHVLRKLERQQEREKKKLEELQKKEEKKKLLEQEMSELAKSKPAAAKQPPKLSRAAIQEQQERERKQREAALAAKKKKEKDIENEPIEENVNRIEVEGDVARSVDEAIAVLSISSKEPEVDIHPEKRVKAAYAAFESANLPRLKAENPTLRLSQLKNMLRKEWNKSPENPLVQAALAAQRM